MCQSALLEFDCRNFYLVIWKGCEFVVVAHMADWSWKHNNELMWDSVCVYVCASGMCHPLPRL